MSTKKDESESKGAAKDATTKPTTDAGQDEVEKTVDEAEETGVIGDLVDPTPSENYTVAGVTSGKPTPESDAEAKAKAQEALKARQQPPAEGEKK